MKFKHLAIAAAFAPAALLAQTVKIEEAPGGWILMRDATRIDAREFGTRQQCADEALGRSADIRAATGVREYVLYCAGRSKVTTTWATAAPVPPPPAPPPPPPPPPPPTTTRVGLGTLPANPVLNPGWSTARVQPTGDRGVPASDGVGAFRTVCNTSHYAYDDPIVYPGQPGRSHMHVFFGNTGANANSTTASLSTTGNGTCAGGILNRSSYWAPAMIDTATNQVVHPTNEVVFYYKAGYRGVQGRDIKPFPRGLRMIAGDPMNATSTYTMAYEWVCHNNYPQNGRSMQNCAVGDELELKVFFPQCWDGVNLDSPDHKSHMAYANGGCPASHPVALPEVSVNIKWPITRPNQASTWRLSSDVYSGPAGYSAHADFWAAWDDATIKTFVENCINRNQDGHAYLLCDGRTLY